MSNYQRYYELLRKLERKYPTLKMIEQHRYANPVRSCELSAKARNVSNYIGNGKPIPKHPGNIERWLYVNLQELRVHNANDLNNRLPEGWYTDEHRDETLIAKVIQFPSRKGQIIMLPCIAESNSADTDGWVLIDSRVDTATPANSESVRDSQLQSVAITADDMARIEAERQREANAQSTAEVEIESQLDEVKRMRTEHTKIVTALRAATAVQFLLFEPGYTPPAGIETAQASVLCKAIHAQLADIRNDVHACIKRVKALRENYWLAVEN